MTEKAKEKPKNVYEAIVSCSADIAAIGISKDRKNAQQGYNFRGIDDVYNAMAPILAANGLVVLPRVLSRDVVERQTKSGGALFYTTVEVEYDFVSAGDGSKHTVKTYGEAMDSADKSTNKAMSAAYKYACMQAFCIPTEGDNDADGTTHEVKAKDAKTKPEVKPNAKPDKPPRTPLQEWLAKAKRELEALTDYELIAVWKNIDENKAMMKELNLAQAKWLQDIINKTNERLNTLNAG